MFSEAMSDRRETKRQLVARLRSFWRFQKFLLLGELQTRQFYVGAGRTGVPGSGLYS
jgi:hypothetical protein